MALFLLLQHILSAGNIPNYHHEDYGRASARCLLFAGLCILLRCSDLMRYHILAGVLGAVLGLASLLGAELISDELSLSIGVFGGCV